MNSVIRRARQDLQSIFSFLQKAGLEYEGSRENH